MKCIHYITAAAIMLSLTSAFAAESVHEFETKTITGEDVDMQDYAGKVLVIVNTASRCGFARQFSALTDLQKEYADKDVVVLGFPSANFGGQELDNNEDIAAFCESNFDIEFPLMTKTDVQGDNQTALFRYLTSADNPDFTGNIRWNFEKFIVDQDGVLRRRFRSRTSPEDKTFRAAIDELLQSE